MTDNAADVAAIELDRSIASGREDAIRVLRSDVRAELQAIRDSRAALKAATVDLPRADITADPTAAILAISRALLDTDRALIAIAKHLTPEV